MKTKTLVALSLALCSAGAAHAESVQLSPECKNLALMQAQLLETQFHNNEMGGGTYNPAKLTLSAKGGNYISKVEFVGGDGDGSGNSLCDTDPSLCTNPADAGGSIEWDRVTISHKDGTDSYPLAEVIVSMGSRGGCTISSAKHL